MAPLFLLLLSKLYSTISSLAIYSFSFLITNY
jgi:hypothetical protein